MRAWCPNLALATPKAPPNEFSQPISGNRNWGSMGIPFPPMSAPAASSRGGRLDPPGELIPVNMRGIVQAFAVLCWTIAVCVFFYPTVNPDIFLHLSMAQHMIATHAWPRTDWLSFTMQGQPWIDSEWLCQLVWYGVFKAAGFWGFVFLKALLFSAAALFLWKTLEIYSLSLESKSLAILAWAMASAVGNDIRPENFSIVFFVLEWWMLEARRLRRASAVPIWLIVPIYALWANLHPGFIYGGILLGIYVAGEVVRERRFELAGWGLVCAAATLINPYGWRLYELLWQHVLDMGELQIYISEWRRMDITNVLLWPFWGVLCLAFAAVFWRYAKDRKVPVEHLLALGFFSLSAANHNRMAVYFAPVGIALIACHLPSMPWTYRARWRTSGIGFATLALMIFFGVKLAPSLVQGEPFIPRYVPDQLIRFLIKERPMLRGRRMMNPWEWGGYFGYYLYPDLQVFFDGRSYIFHPLLKLMVEAAKSPETYQAFMGRYKIDIVTGKFTKQMLKASFALPKGTRIETLRPNYIVFLPENNWALVHWDRQGMVFVRRSAFPKKWVEVNEYRIFRPFDETATSLLVQNGAVSWSRLSREFERFVKESPGEIDEDTTRRSIESIRPPGKV